jgi:hypothetical protein
MYCTLTHPFSHSIAHPPNHTITHQEFLIFQ